MELSGWLESRGVILLGSLEKRGRDARGGQVDDRCILRVGGVCITAEESLVTADVIRADCNRRLWVEMQTLTRMRLRLEVRVTFGSRGGRFAREGCTGQRTQQIVLKQWKAKMNPSQEYKLVYEVPE